MTVSPTPTPSPSPSPTPTPRRGQLARQVNRLEIRLNRLEKASERLTAVILPDPDKAVQVPLLKERVDRLTASTDDEVKAVQRDVDRQFTFITAIVGLFGAALLGQAAARRRAEKESTEADKAQA